MNLFRIKIRGASTDIEISLFLIFRSLQNLEKDRSKLWDFLLYFVQLQTKEVSGKIAPDFMQRIKRISPLL